MTYRQMWSYIRKDGEPVGPARRGACAPGVQMGPRLRGECPAAWSPRAPWRRHCEVVSAAWTEEVTALAGTIMAPIAASALAPAGGVRGGEAREGMPLPQACSDRQGQGHIQLETLTDRHAHTQIHRHPQTRENHPASVWSLETSVTSVTHRHTRQTASRGNSARGKGSRVPHCPAATLLRASERTETQCPCVGGGWETGAEAADRTPGAGTPILTAVSGSFGSHPSH